MTQNTLTRYRVMAYATGVMLLLLVLVAMPLKYLAHSDALVAIVGPVHGFLYIVYVLFALDLALKRKWSPVRTVLVVLAGTIPFASFAAERAVVSWCQQGADAPSPAAADLGSSTGR